jgi:hypothetical protein
VYLGKPLPTVEGAVTTSLTVFNRLTLSGLLDFKFGATAFDVSTYLGCLTARQCEINYFPDQDRVKAAWYALPGVFGRSVTPAHRNFAKIREVSVAYSLPARWLRGLGVTSARIAVTGRELHTFKGSYEGADPETVTQTGTWYYINFHQLPPPTMLLTSIKLTF